jgi:sphingosine kinase
LKSAEFTSLIGPEESESWVDSIREKVFGGKILSSRRRNITILINPFGGTGSGRSIWQSVVPIFKASPINLTVIETTSAGFGERFAKTTELDKMSDGLVTVSGDGLLNEVLNGLLKRPDWDAARRIPIGVIVRLSRLIARPHILIFCIFTARW